MARTFEDLSGNRYGRLYVISRAENNKYGNVQFLCQCDCGNTLLVCSSRLKSGNTRSCGCYKQEYVANKNRKHNLSKTRLYGVWGALVQRCCNPKNADYPDYGGRGIKLTEEWRDFKKFHDWAVANGYDENAEFAQCTIDRIDVNGDYCADNCRFVSVKEQANNKRNSRKFLFNNEWLTISQIAEICNIPYHKLYNDTKKNNWVIPEV